jgi:hypothetical protein
MHFLQEALKAPARRSNRRSAQRQNRPRRGPFRPQIGTGHPPVRSALPASAKSELFRIGLSWPSGPVMNRRLFLLASLATLSACATRPSLVAAPQGANLDELEPLYAVTAGWRGLTISVASHGCVRKEDFTFFVEHHIGSAAVAFARRRLETCPAPPAAARATLRFSYNELGLTPGTQVYVLNPVRQTPAQGGSR